MSNKSFHIVHIHVRMQGSDAGVAELLAACSQSAKATTFDYDRLRQKQKLESIKLIDCGEFFAGLMERYIPFSIQRARDSSALPDADDRALIVHLHPKRRHGDRKSLDEVREELERTALLTALGERWLWTVSSVTAENNVEHIVLDAAQLRQDVSGGADGVLLIDSEGVIRCK